MRGLVPRWGRGGAWQNPLCKFFVPRHNSGTSYPGVPAPAGMSDWNESMSRTPIRDHFRHQPATPTTVARTTTAQGPKRNVGLGLVPSQGWGWGAQMTPLNPPINQCTQFSYLGVPAVAGTSDCYERR